MIKLVEAPAKIVELVDKFERNLEAYKNPSFKEEMLKQDFINPSLKPGVGMWIIFLAQLHRYRDVIFEDSIKVGGTKAPD